jgi:metal transporter CNNM
MSECQSIDMPKWASYLLAGGLVVMSSVFSGLTLGLLALDNSALEILTESGSPLEKKRAKQIVPLRKNGNLLLCTLVIGNVIANSFLSILLAELFKGLKGLIVSTILIVVFGEITPQAICSRHGLLIGSYTRFITWFFLVLLFPVSKPISMMLDCMLGREVFSYYSKEELKTLLKMQVKQNKLKDDDSGIFQDDHVLLVGVHPLARLLQDSSTTACMLAAMLACIACHL